MGMGNIARLGYRAFSRFVLPSRPIVSNARLEPARRNNLLGLRLFALALAIGEVGSLAGRRVIAEPKLECSENICTLTMPKSAAFPKIDTLSFDRTSGLKVTVDEFENRFLVTANGENARAGKYKIAINGTDAFEFVVQEAK